MTVRRGTAATTAMRLTVVVGVVLAWLSPAAAHPPPTREGEPRIAFSRSDEAIGGSALWTATPHGKDQRRLTPGAAYFPSWSPDRSHLLFDFPDENGDQQIGRINADGTGFQQLTDLPGVSEVADYSPDGSTIVFDRYVPQGEDQPFFTSLWVMNADGSDPHPLFDPTSTTFDVEPEYSPDGSTIVFSRIRIDPVSEDETYALFVAAADGSWQRPITRYGAGVEHPHWSPDGRWVLFDVESPQNPRNGVYVVRPNGHGFHRVLRSNEKFVFFKPDFSPDGQRLLLGCFVIAEQQEDLCMLDLRSRRFKRVVRTPDVLENFPAWGS